MDHGPHHKFGPNSWKLSQMKSIVTKWQDMMLHNGGWNALYLENHDQPRSISRFASDEPQHRKIAGKMLATFLALESGTPYIYQGQEIGQINVPRSWGPDKFRDIDTLNHWRQVLREHPDDDEFQKMTLREYWLKGRENARTPMQWDGSKNAGFSSGDQLWMDVHPDSQEWNVSNQVDDPDSVLSHWKAVLRLRKEMKDVFVYGDFEMLSPEDEETIAYLRTFDEANAAMVVTSFKDHDVEWQVPEHARSFLACPVRLRNYPDGPKLHDDSDAITLRPFEAFVFVRSGCGTESVDTVEQAV